MSVSALTAATSPQGVLALYNFPDSQEVETLYQYYGPSGKNLFATIFNRNAPVGGWALCGVTLDVATAQLLARGMLYTPGKSYTTPCPNNGLVPPNFSGAAGVGSAGNLARMGLSTTNQIGAGVAGSASDFASTGLGSAIPIIGPILSLGIAAIMGIIKHHEEAVATEDSTICTVANAVNQTIPTLDSAVVSGAISPGQAIQAMVSFVQQMKNALLRISGVGDPSHPCNAGCVWQSLLDMHVDFANTFYVDVSPMKIAPAVSPGSYAPYAATASIVAATADTISPPGGSAQIRFSTAGQDAPNLNNAGSQNGTFSSVPNILTLGTGTATTTGNLTWIILIALVALGAFLLMHKG